MVLIKLASPSKSVSHLHTYCYSYIMLVLFLPLFLSVSLPPCVYLSRLGLSLFVLCILSATFSGFFLTLSGVLGKVCGSHGNFSELLTSVVDNPYAWGGPDYPQYPLATVLLGQPQFPLTVSSVLESCRMNMSLFRSLHLEQRYDLGERIWLNPQDEVKCS